MRSINSFTSILSLICLLPIVESIFTGGFDLWDIPDNATWIREIKTTLKLPKAPNPQAEVSINPKPDGNNYQTMGRGNMRAAPGSNMTSHYKYNDRTRQYDQYTLVNGRQVSLLSTGTSLV
ncbi:MAG: hypothetical protein Q9162_000599 [Coniocarpon cinnabarinum]